MDALKAFRRGPILTCCTPGIHLRSTRMTGNGPTKSRDVSVVVVRGEDVAMTAKRHSRELLKVQCRKGKLEQGKRKSVRVEFAGGSVHTRASQSS